MACQIMHDSISYIRRYVAVNIFYVIYLMFQMDLVSFFFLEIYKRTLTLTFLVLEDKSH